MSGLEVPGFLIGVAGLFSSCVDAFAYFKLAQRAPKEIEVVLLNLDVEKTRLLIWGDTVGLFSTSHEDWRRPNDHVAEVIPRILSQIENLLTDSEKLRTAYGVRPLDSPLNRIVDYLSSNSFAVFRTSASRFWVRNASKRAAQAKISGSLKIKWAIYEREKFQALVNDLKHFIDTLYELFKVAQEVQHKVILEDIESICDVSHLRIIEEATEDSYRIYSKAAASVRALTEAGTDDRRIVEEYLRDVEGIRTVRLQGSSTTDTATGVDLLWSEVEDTIAFIVLTGKCRKLQTQEPCDMQLLGSQAADATIRDEHIWDISSKNELGGNTLWQLINRLLDRDIKFEVKNKFGKLGKVFEHNQDNLTKEQKAVMQAKLPLLELLIHCSPCVCLLHTALTICKKVSSPLLKVRIRPDDRLISSCCAAIDRTQGLRSTYEWVRQWESTAHQWDSNNLASYLDSVWLGYRLNCLDHELPYDHKDYVVLGKQVAIIGEVDYLTPLVQKVPGRIPRETEIWQISQEIPLKRIFFSRFIELQSVSSQKSSNPQIAVLPLQVQGKTPKIRKAPSLISLDSKRQKSEMGSVAWSGGERNEESEDESMEHSTHISGNMN